jgi:NADP-dependent 3-hydroxy acid dehydrogenase YdfG
MTLETYLRAAPKASCTSTPDVIARRAWLVEQVRELRPKGIKVGVICPGGVKIECALGKGRTAESVAQSAMLEPEDVAAAVVLACTQAPGSRIIEIQMRPMGEPLA